MSIVVLHLPVKLYKTLPGNLKHGQEHSPMDELHLLLIGLSECWDRYTTIFHDAAIPWTNNLLGQMIGRMKIRARTVRSYKSPTGL